MPIEGLSMDMVVYLLGAGFLSAFIDAAVGGGGLISTPALMMTGLPMGTVLGTNKLASMMGSLTSTLWATAYAVIEVSSSHRSFFFFSCRL